MQIDNAATVGSDFPRPLCSRASCKAQSPQQADWPSLKPLPLHLLNVRDAETLTGLRRYDCPSDKALASPRR
jgi:hypothetical protein